MATPITLDEVAALREEVSGVVFARGDEGLAEEAACFNTAIVHDPDVVVGVRTVEDIVAAVRFAAAHAVPVFVQATGHGAFAPITTGVLITTRRMNAIAVDPSRRIASISAGTRWRSVVEAASRYGLAPITGSSVTVGAIGYTLGGVLGPVSRTFGFTADWVRGFTRVPAGARGVRATAYESPDLFWALRGGKGGLGIVVEMDLELVPLRKVYGG